MLRLAAVRHPLEPQRRLALPHEGTDVDGMRSRQRHEGVDKRLDSSDRLVTSKVDVLTLLVQTVEDLQRHVSFLITCVIEKAMDIHHPSTWIVCRLAKRSRFFPDIERAEKAGARVLPL